MAGLPTGTVTFLFMDIEGSTRLLEQLGDQYANILGDYRRLLRAIVQEKGGQEVNTQGDAFFFAFPRARDALAVAVAAQRTIGAHPWLKGTSVRVRMGLHTGEPLGAESEYVGMDVHRAARIGAAGHGGQILLSDVTHGLVAEDLPEGVSLRDLGEHRLKDLTQPRHLFQVVAADLPEDFPPIRSLDALPNNLPRQLTSFVGRDREIEEVKRLLSSARLLTLTGSGGCGKTRLALQVTAELLEEYADGVWLVELAPLSEPALVPQRVTSALGVREERGRPLLTALRDYLKPKELLLVLDNCEHLIIACAQLAEALLRICPNLRILATSRETLGTAGEIAWRVPSLSVPDPRRLFPRRLPPLQALSRYEGVRLFIERAVAALPNFAVTDQNAPALVQVCRQLDGIPLAIELAAARVKVLSVEQIADRLDDRFRLLTGGSRTALPRQQTLRAAVDWSYDLLTLDEQVLFNQLSVFAGGFTLVNCEAVCAGDGIEAADVLELLSRLVDKSMVTVEETGDKSLRYRLLETLREYGGTRLVSSGKADAIQRRHVSFFLALAEQAEPQLLGPDQAAWLHRLEAEHENFRAALRWCVDRAEADIGLRLGGALWRFWYHRGYFREGRGHLERVLGVQGASLRTAIRAKALNGAGNLAYNQGDYAAAHLFHEESLTIARESGDRQAVARSLNNLGLVARERADYPEAQAMFAQALAINRATGNRAWEAINLNNLGLVAYYRGNYPAARGFQEESLAIQQELHDKWGIAMSLNALGDVARDQRNYDEARSLYEESLEIRRELRDKRGLGHVLDSLGLLCLDQGDLSTARTWLEESLAALREIIDTAGIAQSLESFAALAGAQGQPERALGLAGAAVALREEIGAPLAPLKKAYLEARLASARDELGQEASTVAWHQGREMTLEEAVAYALGQMEHITRQSERTSLG